VAPPIAEVLDIYVDDSQLVSACKHSVKKEVEIWCSSANPITPIARSPALAWTYESVATLCKFATGLDAKLHQVSRRDTIDIAAIRMMSDLPSNNIHTACVLRIPTKGAVLHLPQRDEEEVRRADLLHLFKSRNRLDIREAKLYMEEANYRIAAAQTILDKELEFERKVAATGISSVMGQQPPSTVAIALQETLALTTHSTAPIVPLPRVSQDAHGLHRNFSLAAPSAPVLEMPFSSLVSTQPPRVDSMSSSIYPALPSSTVDASWYTMPMQSMPVHSAGVPYVSSVSQAAYASVAPSAPPANLTAAGVALPGYW
jgi:hypothetical protein